MKHKKTQAVKQSSQQNETLLLVGFLSLILLHVVGGFWHSYYSWGFSYWSVFSQNMILVYGLVSIVLLLTTYYFKSKINLNIIYKINCSKQSKAITIIIYSFVLIIVSYILFIFRSKAHYYGDGFLIIDNILETDDLFAESKNYMELFTIYLFHYLTSTVQKFGSISTEEILAAINSIAGSFGIWAIWSITNLIGTSKEKAHFIFVTALTSAGIILFFGYIENYTLALVAGLWTLRFSIGYVKEENGVIQLIVLSILSIGFHLISFPFFMIALFSILLNSYKEKFFLKLPNFTLSFLILVGTLLIVFISQTKGLTVFVALWELPNNSYSFLSQGHITDVFNQLILVAPMGVLLFVFIILRIRNNKYSESKISKILYILSLLTFLTACFIDPQLGAVRDFDLLSFYGIPLTILAGYKVTNYFDDNNFPQWIIIATLLISFVHVIPNLYEKNNPNIAVEYLDKVLWDDPHYQSNYQDAYRGNSWGYILRKESKRNDLAEKYFARRLDADTKDSNPCYNIGVLYLEQGKYDAARYYLQKGFELNRSEPKFLSELAIIEEITQNHQLAEEYASESLKIDSNHVQGLTALAVIYGNQKRTNEALYYFRKAYDLKPNNYSQIINLGILYEKTANLDSAMFYLTKAELIAPANQKPNILASLISLHLSNNNMSKAIEYLNQLKVIIPNSDFVREKEKEINSR